MKDEAEGKIIEEFVGLRAKCLIREREDQNEQQKK